MYFAGARGVFVAAVVMLLPLLGLSEASIDRARCEDPNSCMVDASEQPKALVQVRGMLKDTGSSGSDVHDGNVQEESLNPEFDCAADVQNRRFGWSNAKKEWCCTHENTECDFDCTAGVRTWRTGWSDAKKEWCCIHQQIGCDCTAGEVANWKEGKATWCCQNELVGCGFNCSAGYSNWQRGWSTLKMEYCCKNELRGCTFDCSEDWSNRTLAWPSIKKAWCCKTEGAGCEEKRPCQTEESKLADGAWRLHVAPPGTPCMFGLDDRDEGYHCILDTGSYGSWGWCYTATDRSSWGACNADCPLFGPLKKIGDRLKKDLIAPVRKFGDRLKHLEKIEKQQEGPSVSNSGPAAKEGTAGSDGSKARSDAGNAIREAKKGASVNPEAKKGDDKKGGKKDGKKDATNNIKADAKKDAKKGANKGNDKNGGKKDEKKDAAKKAAKKDGKKA